MADIVVWFSYSCLNKNNDLKAYFLKATNVFFVLSEAEHKVQSEHTD